MTTWEDFETFIVCEPKAGLARELILQNDGRSGWRLVSPWPQCMDIAGMDIVAEGQAACQAIISLVSGIILS